MLSTGMLEAVRHRPPGHPHEAHGHPEDLAVFWAGWLPWERETQCYCRRQQCLDDPDLSKLIL